MNLAIFERLAALEGVTRRPGIDPLSRRAISISDKGSLPDDHLDFLEWSNGVEAFGGYFRLFGIRPAAGIDLVEWNADRCWKFAWNGRASAYLCFGETAWGDQYAYSIDRLEAGDASVYFLDGLAMEQQKIADGFLQFFSDEFLRNAKAPYDSMTILARQRLGDLPADENIACMPSPLLGAEEDPDNIARVNARVSMICAGDLATQIDALPADSIVSSVETYEDTEGRLRLRLMTRPDETPSPFGAHRWR